MHVDSAAYVLLVIRGLEHLAIKEIHEKLEVTSLTTLTLQADPNNPKMDVMRGEAAVGKLLLHTTSTPAQVKALCSIQAFLAYLAHADTIPTTDIAGPDVIATLVATASTWPAALQLWEAHCPQSSASSVRFRASCVRDGKHAYSSETIAGKVGAAVVAKFGYGVSLAAFDLEVVCLVMHHHVVLGLSLADDPEAINFRGSRLAPERRRIPTMKYMSTLRPSTAYLMLQLAECSIGDIVLDCMCGVGTLPASSVFWAPVVAFGGDISTDAVAQANTNFQGQRANVCQWSSAHLPVRSNAVDCVLVDMPFGLLCGNSTQNAKLYPKAIKEMARVLRPGGRAVLLVMSKKLLVHSVRNVPSIAIVQDLPVTIGGLGVGIYILEKQASKKRSLSDS
ncbi:Aste57867_20172 [Aphanomyces stellatus]|uniref:Aste57867_20172 protein n=1 Tax=Aphanomyces stellatus TaxID=120398 RepID=A0A485LJ24_9STRA|nr:hypothetical protein As57867_020106 [Aphanomyces stellatus]VFT96866.1 Aste57867_20172 [Aphanomyces stellatus]